MYLYKAGGQKYLTKKLLNADKKDRKNFRTLKKLIQSLSQGFHILINYGRIVRVVRNLNP
jgi:hypothetical protein